MVKLSARVACAVVAASSTCAQGAIANHVIRYGKREAARVEADGTIAISDRASGILLQDTSVNLVAGGSTNKHHMKSVKLLDELDQLATGAKELPASIRGLLDTIKTQAITVVTKLKEEHQVQRADLELKYAAFGLCVAPSPIPPNTVAQAAKVKFCDCLQGQARDKLNSNGCQDELTCRNLVLNTSRKNEANFLRLDDGTVKDQYKKPSGVGMCSDSSGWLNANGVGDRLKASTWFADQKVVWNNYWTEKKNDYNVLITATTDAENARDLLKTKTNQGCDVLSTTLRTKENECTEEKTKFEIARCNSGGDACGAYNLCYDPANTAWQAAVVRETKSWNDRKIAWVSAKMVECLVDAFTDNAAGNIEVDETAHQACKTKTCDGDCAIDLDMTALLAKVPPTKQPCPTAPPITPCSCDSNSWGEHTPLYFVGDRIGDQCHVATVAVNLGATAGVAASCSDCS